MSWLGGLNDSFNQLTSITGQIGGQLSNFTKEVLTETTDENIDYEVEAKRLSEKLKQDEAQLHNLKQENSILKERVHRTELELSTLTIDYEAKLQDRAKEISILKQKLSANQGNNTGSGIGAPILSSSFSNVSLTEEDEDFHEIINYQQEINRLSAELDEMRQEAERWREKAEAAKNMLSTGIAGRKADALDGKVRELEDALRREASHHHQELRTIQDANAATVARYQDEIRKLKILRSDSPDLTSSDLSSQEHVHHHKEENKMLEIELESLKEQMRNRNRQLQMQKKQMKELDESLKEKEIELQEVTKSRNACIEDAKQLKEEKKKIEDENERNKGKLSKIIQALTGLLSTKDLVFDERNVAQSLDDLAQLMNDLFGERVEILAENATLQTQIQNMKSTIAELSVRPEQVLVNSSALIHGGDPSCHAELAESDQWHQERTGQTTGGQDHNIESDQFQKQLLPAHLDFGTPLGHSSPQVSKAGKKTECEVPVTPTPHNPGDLTLTLQALQRQVEDYELEIEQYEQVQSEWQAEKKSLQDLLNRYQNEVAQNDEQMPNNEPQDERAIAVKQLRQELEELREARGNLEKETNRLLQEKEQLHVATKNLSEELNTSITNAQSERDQNAALRRQIEKFGTEKEKLQSAYEVLSQEFNKSREEKEDLDQALDVLDAQHQDEMAQLLTVRDDFKEKLKTLQKHLEQEQEENANLRKKIEASADVDSQNLVAALQEQREKINSLDSHVRELQKIKQQLEMEAADTKKDCDVIREDREKILVTNEELAVSLEESRKKVIETQREVLEKDEDCKALRIKMEDINSRFTASEKDLAGARSRLNEMNVHYDDKVKKRDLEFKDALKEKDLLIASLRSQLVEYEHNSLQMKTNVLADEESLGALRASVREKDAQVEQLSLEKLKLEERFSCEVTRLQEEIDALGAEMENTGKEMGETQSKHDEQLKRMQRENQDAIDKIQKDSKEKLELVQSNHALFHKEADATNRVYLEKISHLEKLNEDLQKKLEEVETEDTARISKLSRENEYIIQNLRQQHTDLTQQYSTLSEQHEALKNAMQSDISLLENKLKIESEQKLQLGKDCVDLKNLLQKASMVETSLSTEMASLKLELENSRKKVSDQALLFEDRGTTESENDDKVQSLIAEIETLKKRLSGDSAEIRSNLNVEDLLRNLDDFSGVEKSDLSKDDIGSLLQLIKERDNIIEILRQRLPQNIQNLSSASVEAVKQLEDANRSLVAEKDQILAVISEKTRENKKLKDDAHKMMGVMAESRAALAKVQQENASLLAKYEGYDKEMTKETVVKLSRLVTEKELEIESLNQKCGTLLEVLQQQPGGIGADTTVSGQQVQSLIQDKETLSGQVQQLLNERNHLVALLNQRQIEVDTAREEVSKAAQALERDADDNSKLQIDYGNLVHDYDQTQLRLSSVQKEVGSLREKMLDLETVKNSLLQKVDNSSELELLGKSEEGQRSPHVNRLADGKENQRISELSETLEQKEIILRQLNEDNSRKSDEIVRLQNDSMEKDLLIHSRTEELNKAKKDLAAKTNEAEILRKSVENLREQVAGLSINCDDARVEVRDCLSRLNEKTAESQAFQETNAQLSMLLKEKEYELENAREKCERLENMTRENQEGQDSETQRLLVELDNSKQALIAARHERDQIMLALKQKKIEGDKSSEEARSLREKEVKLESELARLRNHLIQVEEAYTQEAVLAEDREASLKEQLQKTKSSQNAVREASELSQQQAESLQEQLRTAHSQRDQAIHQLQLSQEQGMQYATALQKLQLAVERMQREEAANFAEQLDRVKVQLEEKVKAANTYEIMANDLKVKLENANEALKSASRLSSQLELKEENITQLKNIVAEKQVQIDELQDKMHLVLNKNEGMVDKEIIKNLIIGYFTSSNNKRPDVLRLIEAVLGFSQDETRRVHSGPQQGGARAWIGGWLGWRGSDGTQHQRPSMSLPASPRSGAVNESFTQMFVKFLENESVPHQAVQLPVAAMINEAQQKRRPPLSPGLSSVPTPVGFTSAERAGPSVAGRYSPYLLSSNGAPTRGPAHPPSSQSIVPHPITPVLPTFTPIISPKTSSEKEILRDILLNASDKR